jgi:hypothetical protein
VLQSLKSAIQLRAFIVFTLIHLGLGLAIFQLASVWGDPALAPHLPQLKLILTGLLGVYGGVLLGIFFIVWPMLPWIQRARRLQHWREWILEVLPEILATLPVIVQAARTLIKTWEEMKGPAAASAQTPPAHGSPAPVAPAAPVAPTNIHQL